MKNTIIGLAIAFMGLASAQSVNLVGAGATFPQRLYTVQYFPTFNRLFSSAITYQAVGSSKGIGLLRERKVHFGASDAPLSDQQLGEMRRESGSQVLHIPTAVGGIAVGYNLPGIADGLRLDADVLVGVFLGQVTRWNDPALRALNPQLDLPNLPIVPIYRGDGSGTTYIFSSYLSAVSPTWLQRFGRGREVKFPVGRAADGNSGMAELVRQTPGAIGYMDRNASTANLSVAALKNRSGQFVQVAPKTVSRALQGVAVPADMRLINQVVDTSDPEGYPIVGMTWILIYQNQELTADSKEQAEAVVALLQWISEQGQKFNSSARFAELTPEIRRRNLELLRGVTFKGQRLL